MEKLKKQQGPIWQDPEGNPVQEKRLTLKEKFDETNSVGLINKALAIESELNALMEQVGKLSDKSYLMFLKEKGNEGLFQKTVEAMSETPCLPMAVVGYTWYSFNKKLKIVRTVQPVVEWDENLMQLSTTKFNEFFNARVPESIAWLKSMVSDALESRGKKFDSRKINGILQYKNNEDLKNDSMFQDAISTLETAKIKSEKKRVYYAFYVQEGNTKDYRLINLNFSYL